MMISYIKAAVLYVTLIQNVFNVFVKTHYVLTI